MEGHPATLTVGEVTRQIKTLLEGHFPHLWVRGEISNLHRHSSGHVYFTLKDDQASLRAVMFRGYNQWLRFQPADGMQILAQGRISLYERRGQYQLVVQLLEPAGVGTLYLAFEALKRQLAGEGLFAPEHKQPLPVFPETVGLITSPTGAVLQDIIEVLGRRAPQVNLVLRPTQVQGPGAAADIVAAVEEMVRFRGVEVIILARGGGSLEDLWPFNEEPVARAIFACPLPVLSAVGHETDLTIADLVADLRAPTPSAAAELVAPARAEILQRRLVLRRNLITTLGRLLERWWQELDHILDRYAFQQPQNKLVRRREQLASRREQMLRTLGHRLEMGRSVLQGLEKELVALNPTNILQRGYSIAFRRPGREVIRAEKELAVGGEFELQTARGSLLAEKKATLEKNGP